MHCSLYSFLFIFSLLPPARSWSLVSWNAGGFFARIKDADLLSDITKHDVILVQETQTIEPPFLASHDVWAIPAIPNPQRGAAKWWTRDFCQEKPAVLVGACLHRSIEYPSLYLTV